MERRDRLVLEEYVRGLINEDWGDTEGGFGMMYASPKDMYDVFIKPFADVIGVASGRTQELMAAGGLLLKTVIWSAVTTVVPFISQDYQEIFSDYRSRIDKIKQDHADVYKATWDAFRDEDFLVASFFYAPDKFLTAYTARKAPLATAKLLNTLSGGKLDSVVERIRRAMHKVQRSAVSPLKGTASTVIGGLAGKATGALKDIVPGASEARYYRGEELVEKEDKRAKAMEKIADYVTSDKLVSTALSGAPAQAVQKATRAATQGTLERVLKSATTVMQAKSLEDVQRFTGKPIKGLDKLQNVQGEERQKAEAQALSQIKDEAKKFYVKSLTGDVKQMVQAGVPKDNPMIAAYVKTIEAIKKL
jgi:uncharacterized protein YjgD (DUF1641 family)